MKRMFKTIGYRLALQFTLFVFLLFLINGTIFLVADFNNAKQQARLRLERSSHSIIDRAIPSLHDIGSLLPPNIHDRVRVIGPTGETAYAAPIFEGIPFTAATGVSDVLIGDERYNVLTLPITQNGKPFGFIQIAEIERLPLNDLPFRAFIYVMVSLVVSALTFMVGLFFARRNLRPVEEMVSQLEQFTQDASHELRTPLAVLSSSLDLSLKTKKYKEGILSAKDDLKEIATLVERLLELARMDRFRLEKQQLDLSALTEQSIEKFRLLAAEKHLTITSDIADTVMTLGDAALLRQVICNLLSNAIKFTPARGSIVVHLTKDTLSIEDTGIGIAQKSVPYIFDRFYQADHSRANEGFGLGLALVKRILDLHQWTVHVQSKVGKGTTFTLHFPHA